MPQQEKIWRKQMKHAIPCFKCGYYPYLSYTFDRVENETLYFYVCPNPRCKIRGGTSSSERGARMLWNKFQKNRIDPWNRK